MVDHHLSLPPKNASQNSQQTQSSNLEPLPSSTMVVIRDNNDSSSVFPPSNHENLQIFSHTHQHHHIPESPSSSSTSSSSSSSSVSSFSLSDTDAWGLSSSSTFDSQVQKGGDFIGWMSIGLQILRSKLFAMVSSFRNYAANRGAIWSIGPVVMSCWITVRVWCWLMQRKRRRMLTRNDNHLMNIIQEKDGRIAQLLHQIAQMNEILIARHKALAAKLVE